jgi:hypothetical protein
MALLHAPASAAACPLEATTTFASLPPALAACVFSCVPVDTRLRCAEVCPAWRATLVAEASAMWTRLDFSSLGDDTRCHGAAADALLAAAAARAAAAGGLHALDASFFHPTPAALLAVVRDHAATLRELRADRHDWYDRVSANNDDIDTLLAAAPRLQTCSLGVYGNSFSNALRALHAAEAPSTPLQLRSLCVSHSSGTNADDTTLLEFARAVGAHAHLEKLELETPPLGGRPALYALADAVRKHPRLSSLTLMAYDRSCWRRLRARDTVVLARMLRGNTTLTSFALVGDCVTKLVDVDGVAALFAALRKNRTLTRLLLNDVSLWRRDAMAGAMLVSTLAGHASLRELDLSCNAFAKWDVVAGTWHGRRIADAPPSARARGRGACHAPGGQRAGAAHPARVLHATGQRRPEAAAAGAARQHQLARAALLQRGHER